MGCPSARDKGNFAGGKRDIVHLHIADVNAIKTKKEGPMLMKNHIDFVNEYGRNILEFVKDMGGFDYKSVHKSDVFSFLSALLGVLSEMKFSWSL